MDKIFLMTKKKKKYSKLCIENKRKTFFINLILNRLLNKFIFQIKYCKHPFLKVNGARSNDLLDMLRM